MPEGFQRAMRQTGAVNARKALWWGDGAKPHIQKMLRYLLLEMFGLSLTVPFLYEWWRYKGMVLGMTRFDCRMPCILLRNYVFLWVWGYVWDCRPKPRLGISSPNPIFASRRLKAAFVESGTLRSLILAFTRFVILGVTGLRWAAAQTRLRGIRPGNSHSRARAPCDFRFPSR